METSTFSKVLNLCEKIMSDPKFVKIHYKDGRINAVAKHISKFYAIKNLREGIIISKKEILKILLSCSIDYCFWYGLSNIRPNGSSSEKMWGIIENEVESYFTKCNDEIINREELIKGITKRLIIERFPLAAERSKHIREVIESDYINWFYQKLQDTKSKLPPSNRNMNEMLNELIVRIPGFASDMFLKRAFLFFILLNRRCGILQREMNYILLPADYQVPKIMKFYKILQYNSELEHKINNHELIQKGSQMEIEIRAASILAADKLRVKSDSDIEVVDFYLWSRRREVNIPFHQTITTDY